MRDIRGGWISACAWICLIFSVGCAGDSLRLLRPTAVIRTSTIPEASGCVASRHFENVLWVHNDDGSPEVFALTLEGELLRSYRLPNAVNIDWEDIAIDSRRRLYVYDNLSREQNSDRAVIYRFPEPDPFHSDSEVMEIERFEVIYPEANLDVETLFIDDESAILVSKPWDGSLPKVFVTDGLTSEVQARQTAEIQQPAMMTGGDISHSAVPRRIALSSYRAVLVYEGAGSASEILAGKPLICQMNAGQVEGITWVGDDLVLTSEQGNIFRISYDQWSNHRAPFQRRPVAEVPYLKRTPHPQVGLRQWTGGRWLKARTGRQTTRLAKIGWNREGLFIGIRLPRGITLGALRAPDGDDFDNWFEPGLIYLNLDPSGTRPLSYGQDNRCLVVGMRDSRIQIESRVLRPATVVQKVEKAPSWTKVYELGRQEFLVVLTPDTPGFARLKDERTFGFNVLITDQESHLISWSPLTTRFPWDAPSIWGLLVLDD